MNRTVIEELRDAILEPDAAAQRTALRAIVSSMVRDTPHYDTLIRDTWKVSPLIGTGPREVNPSATSSGLVGSLDIPTMIWLACDNGEDDGNFEDRFDYVIGAIHNPSENGVADPTGKTKTGYIFGASKFAAPIAHGEAIANATHTTGLFKGTHMHYTLKNTFSLVLITELMNNIRLPSTDKIVIVVNEKMAGDIGPFEAARKLYAEGQSCTIEEHGNYDCSDEYWQSYQEHYDFIFNHITDLDVEDKIGSVMASFAPAMRVPDANQSLMLDAVLTAAGMPAIKTMVDQINTSTSALAASAAKMSELEQQIKDASMAAVMPVVAAAAVSSGAIPAGKVVLKNAAEVFGLSGAAASQFGFDVTVWEWDGVHPHVPVIDPSYIFRPEELLRCLYALLTNQRAYFYGHTGTGKTTLIEQVAARLLWPFMRVNFDSEITRMDLIGRDTLSTEGGVTVSKFEDGILPQAMSGPYILCCDEVDFVRPDVAYVMQRALEGNGLLLTEDGGRVIEANPMFRMFATGNTQGQGDEHGMYAGARPQSMAFLDRFTVWCQVDYLGANDRKKLIKAKVPSLTADQLELVHKYSSEHIAAFTNAKIMQPLSPRGMISLAQAIAMFSSMAAKGDEKGAIKRAFGTTVLDRATSNDHAVMHGIMDRLVA